MAKIDTTNRSCRPAAITGGAIGTGGALSGLAFSWETPAGGGGKVSLNGGNPPTADEIVSKEIEKERQHRNFIDNWQVEGGDYTRSLSGHIYEIEFYSGPHLITGTS